MLPLIQLYLFGEINTLVDEEKICSMFKVKKTGENAFSVRICIPRMWLLATRTFTDRLRVCKNTT